MDKWLKPALDYIPRWIEFQMESTEQPGCSLAIVHRDKLVCEKAFGVADVRTAMGEEAALVMGRGGKAIELVLAETRLALRAAAQREARKRYGLG
ncbi:MAG: hypothetical protein ABWZ80_02895, partial [Beijerinckiaceae bacterium]